jgi:hypothetical protein
MKATLVSVGNGTETGVKQSPKKSDNLIWQRSEVVFVGVFWPDISI